MKTLFLLIWMSYAADKSPACKPEPTIVYSSSGYVHAACNLKIEHFVSLDDAKAATMKKDIDDGIIYEIATGKRIRVMKKHAITYSYEFKEVK